MTFLWNTFSFSPIDLNQVHLLLLFSVMTSNFNASSYVHIETPRQGCHIQEPPPAATINGVQENRRKIEPKEIPSCLIPCQLAVFTQQLEILVRALPHLNNSCCRNLQLCLLPLILYRF